MVYGKCKLKRTIEQYLIKLQHLTVNKADNFAKNVFFLKKHI
jgi:hypothetical protein